MLNTTVLRVAAAAVMATAALALAPSVAFAADAAIGTDSDVYAVSDSVAASGTCPDAAVSAVVEVTQSGASIGSAATDVTGGAWSASVAISGDEGQATASVSCLAYGSSAAIDTASIEIFLAADEDFVDVPVAVSPSSVAIGSDVTVTATCPVGSTSAQVLLGNTDADEAFFSGDATPAADGTVTLTTTVGPGGDVAPEAGGAVAVVFCDGDTAGFGTADFTVTAAAATPPAASDDDGESLANTGTQAGQLAQIAVMLLIAGAAAVIGSRRIQRV